MGHPCAEGSTQAKAAVRTAAQRDSYPQSWASKLHSTSSSPIEDLAGPWRPCLKHLISLLARGRSEQAPSHAAEGRSQAGTRSDGARCRLRSVLLISLHDVPRLWQRTELATTSLSPSSWRDQSSSHLFASSCLFSGCVFLFTCNQQSHFNWTPAPSQLFPYTSLPFICLSECCPSDLGYPTKLLLRL